MILLGMLVSGLAYDGESGQSYRVANHFVSELGELGISDAAWAFNVGLIVGGALLVAFAVGLAAYFRGVPRIVLGILGVVTGVFGALVGVVPMNYSAGHTLVANWFFYPGLATMTFFSLWMLVRGRAELPRWVAAPGLVSAASLFAFLFLSETIASWLGVPASATGSGGRPDIWIKPLFEWVAIGSILLWVLAVSLSVIAGRRRAGRDDGARTAVRSAEAD